MYKLLVGVFMFAGVSFAGLISVDLNLPTEGFSHQEATLIRVDLDKYLADAGLEGQEILTAELQFFDIQNNMEPETNDKLYVNIVNLSTAGVGQQDYINKKDNETPTNYFTSTLNSSLYTTVDELMVYTDENDNAVAEAPVFKGAYWEKTQDYLDEYAKGLIEGYSWSYDSDNSNWGYWIKHTGLIPEDFKVALNVADITNFITDGTADGWIGIGVDADCHYSGSVKLVVTTKQTNVPEPTLLSLLGCGLLGLAFFRRKKS
jgi:hypothetical protein